MREAPKVDTDKRREGGQCWERVTKGGNRQEKGRGDRGMREAPKVDTDKGREGENRGMREAPKVVIQTREGKGENRGMREAPKVDTDKRREGRGRRTEA